MMALYMFCAALGVPLLAFFAFAGDGEGGGDGELDLGDAGELGDAGNVGIGGQVSSVMQIIPLSSVAIGLAGFGVTGLLATWVGAGALSAFVLAVVVAVVCGALNSVAFSYLRRTSSTSHTKDRSLEGLVGRVSVPINDDHRGRIVVEVQGQRMQLTAAPYLKGAGHEPIGIGQQALIVAIDNGVALVSSIDRELD